MFFHLQRSRNEINKLFTRQENVAFVRSVNLLSCGMDVKLEESWKQKLSGEFTKPYFLQLINFIKEEKATHTIFPPGPLIFNAFEKCPFPKVNMPAVLKIWGATVYVITVSWITTLHFPTILLHIIQTCNLWFAVVAGGELRSDTNDALLELQQDTEHAFGETPLASVDALPSSGANPEPGQFSVDFQFDFVLLLYPNFCWYFIRGSDSSQPDSRSGLNPRGKSKDRVQIKPTIKKAGSCRSSL